MKLKNVELKKVNKLKRLINEINLDLSAITKEHSLYLLSSDDWFNSLPIESLKESIDKDRCNVRTKYSLNDMKHNFALKRLFKAKEEELEKAKIEYNIANIDYLLSQIKNIESKFLK